jgi:hypothetical protein
MSKTYNTHHKRNKAQSHNDITFRNVYYVYYNANCLQKETILNN